MPAKGTSQTTGFIVAWTSMLNSNVMVLLVYIQLITTIIIHIFTAKCQALNSTGNVIVSIFLAIDKSDTCSYRCKGDKKRIR